MNSYTIKLTPHIAQAAILGGAFLGGGGGGHVYEGLENAKITLEEGRLTIISLDQVNPDDIIVTAALVGSPASTNGYVGKEQLKKVLHLYQECLGQKVAGIITNENGGGTTTNGWILAALTGLPFIDAPCNGRAHPTGQMGSMGLGTVPGFISHQAAAGGKKENGVDIEMAVSANLDAASRMIRAAAVESDGLVGVLRNGVKASYLRENAAVGAIKQAIEVGELFLQHANDNAALLAALTQTLGMEILAEGKVDSCSLEIAGGYDIGKVCVGDMELTFWNEYMTAEKGGKRLATFPDLIATLDKNTCEVKTSASIRQGDEIIVVNVPKKNLLLGRGMFEKDLFVEAENVLGKELVKYNF